MSRDEQITLSDPLFHRLVTDKYKKGKNGAFRYPLMIFYKNRTHALSQRFNIELMLRYSFHTYEHTLQRSMQISHAKYQIEGFKDSRVQGFEWKKSNNFYLHLNPRTLEPANPISKNFESPILPIFHDKRPGRKEFKEFIGEKNSTCAVRFSDIINSLFPPSPCGRGLGGGGNKLYHPHPNPPPSRGRGLGGKHTATGNEQIKWFFMFSNSNRTGRKNSAILQLSRSHGVDWKKSNKFHLNLMFRNLKVMVRQAHYNRLWHRKEHGTKRTAQRLTMTGYVTLSLSKGDTNFNPQTLEPLNPVIRRNNNRKNDMPVYSQRNEVRTINDNLYFHNQQKIEKDVKKLKEIIEKKINIEKEITLENSFSNSSTNLSIDNINLISDSVYRNIEQKLSIEREKRGLG